MVSPSWRQLFIELCEAIFRELHFDPPAMLHEDHLPLAMELDVEQRSFELVHSSSEHPERILVTCRLGPLPDDTGRAHYAAMLAANLRATRDYAPSFGVHADREEVIWSSYEKLEGLRASTILEKLREFAREAENWKADVFTEQHGIQDFVSEVSGVTLA